MTLRLHLRAVASKGWLKAWLLVLASAVALTLLVELDAMPDEAGVVREVQGPGFPGKTISDVVRDLTTTSFVIVMGIVIAAAHQVEGNRRASTIVVALLVALLITQTGIKELVDRPRPSEAAAGIEVRASQTSPGFPAGHVMGPTVVYGWALVMLLRTGRRRRGHEVQRAEAGRIRGPDPSARQVGGRRLPAIVRWPLAGLLGAIVVLTGIVNVWLGVHWPTDVLGGYLWGLALLLPGMAIDEAAGETRA